MRKADRFGADESLSSVAAGRLRRAGAVGLSLVLIASLALPVAGIAFAKEAGAEAQDAVVQPLAAQGIAQQGEAPLANAGAEAEQDVPEFKGSDLVERYLEGYDLTLDDLAGIDFDALEAWDDKVAKELRELRQRLQDAAAAVPGTDTDASAPSSDAQVPQAPAADPDASSGDAERVGALADDASKAADRKKAEGTMAADELPESHDPFDPTQEYPEWTYYGDTSFTMVRYTDDMDAQKLVAVIGEAARQAAQRHGVSASEMIALAIARSDSGRSAEAQAPLRNLFCATGYEAVELPAGATSERPFLSAAATDDPNPFRSQRTSRKFESRVTAAPQREGEGDRTQVTYRFDDVLQEYATYGECLDDHAARVAQGVEDSVPQGMEDQVRELVEAYDLTRYDEPLGYEPAYPLTVTWWDDQANTSVEGQATLADLVSQATSHLGVPYVWGGTTPAGFDCSGLVQYAYGHALQREIPRTTYYQCLQGQDVDFADLHMGDLVFFTRDGVCGHVGMYLGEGCYLEAPHEGAQVRVTTMAEAKPDFAKRLVATQPVERQEEPGLGRQQMQELFGFMAAAKVADNLALSASLDEAR